MIRVLFQYEAGPRLQAQLAALRERGIEVFCRPESEGPLEEAELAGVRAIWHVLQPVTAAAIERAPDLTLIQKIGVGVNTIDLEAARARDIAVCNMPGTNSQAVAEMTLLLMLAALRRLPAMDAACRSGRWILGRDDLDGLGEIAGRTVGLVGFGEVPRRLAPVLQAMGAEVIYTARQDKNLPYPRVELNELLERADIVSLHIPLTEETGGLIGEEQIARMKRGAILVNTARGPLVDEAALLAALRDGQLGAAGLDVFTEEPARSDNSLLALGNVAVAPHLAWLTGETLARSLGIAADNTLAALRGGQLQHRVA